MIVFKFGGASVKDVEGVKNLKKIISLYQNQRLLVVVSAMGKMTNALEEVVKARFFQKTDFIPILNLITIIINFNFSVT